jgi:TolA-binding protein
LYLRVIFFPIIIPLSWVFFIAQERVGHDGTIGMQILLTLLGCLQIYLLIRKGKQDHALEAAREAAAAERRREEREERERVARELKEEQNRVADQLRERLEQQAGKVQEVREVVEQRVAAQLEDNNRMTKESMEDTKRTIGSIDNLNRMFMEFTVASNVGGNGHNVPLTPAPIVQSIKTTVEETKDMVEEIKDRGVGDGGEQNRPGG